MTHSHFGWLLGAALLTNMPVGAPLTALAAQTQPPQARAAAQAPRQTTRPPAVPGAPELPPWKDVELFVGKYFARLRIAPDALVTQSQVKPLLAELIKAGWNISDARKVFAAVPHDGEFLVQQLRTPAGRKFEADVARYPGAYDRLDRLSRMPHGKATIEALIRGPDGYKMLQYMSTTPGGKNLGRQLSEAPTGKDFNDPTGRIYTPKELLGRLKQSYARDAARQRAGR